MATGLAEHWNSRPTTMAKLAMADFYRAKCDMTPPYNLRIMISSLQAAFLAAHGEEYYQAYTEHGYPRGVASRALRGRGALALTEEQRGSFYDNLVARHLSTSISQRAVFRRFVEISHVGVVGERPTGIDVGCGNNSGNIRSALPEQFPFGRVTILSPDNNGKLDGPTVAFNRLVGSVHTPGHWIGIDIDDPGQLPHQLWIRSCAQPEEVASGKLAKEDQIVRAAAGGAVGFVRQNFAEQEEVDDLIGRIGPVDMVNFSFSYLQGGHNEREAKLQNALRCLRPQGIVSLLEPAEINGDATLRIMEDWSQMNGFVVRQSDAGMRIDHVMSFTDGRCTSARLEPYGEQLLAEFASR
ncbi:MAG TPA: hypothetical protein VLH84_05475 [Patescibacteria group bacterium]|nr:hypothetical protein [Patescibacteria group bacterium]